MTCVDSDISVYDVEICIYDMWSPTMLRLRPRGDSNISVYDGYISQGTMLLFPSVINGGIKLKL